MFPAEPAGGAGPLWAVARPWRLGVGLSVLFALSVPCRGGEPPARNETPPPMPASPAAPPLDLLEYLGDLQRDEHGWYGPEELGDAPESAPQRGARVDPPAEEAKR